MLDIARLEPGEHVANELGLSLRHAMIVNPASERAIERVPIMPRRNAGTTAGTRNRCGFGFRHMKTVEEAVLLLEALDLDTPDQHVRGRDGDAFGRFGDPAEFIVAALDATDRNRRTRCAVAAKQRQQM